MAIDRNFLMALCIFVRARYGARIAQMSGWAVACSLTMWLEKMVSYGVLDQRLFETYLWPVTLVEQRLISAVDDGCCGSADLRFSAGFNCFSWGTATIAGRLGASG